VVALWESTGEDYRVPVADVEEEVRRACRRWQVREIVCDPFRWTRTMQALEAEGLPVVEFPQSPARMTPATTRLYEAIVNNAVTHSGDGRLARHVGNCVLRVDSRGSRLAKEHKHSTRRIDLAVAAVIGARAGRGAGGAAVVRHSEQHLVNSSDDELRPVWCPAARPHRPRTAGQVLRPQVRVRRRTHPDSPAGRARPAGRDPRRNRGGAQPMSDATVTVAEVAAASGRKAADVEREAGELGLVVKADWSGRPALSVDDARALASGDARRTLEHERAWEAHRVATKAWTEGRTKVIYGAAAKVRARVGNEGAGSVSAEAQRAATEAAEHYERSVPRPAFNGSIYSVNLEYINQEVGAR
jgi:hypothetical protein